MSQTEQALRANPPIPLFNEKLKFDWIVFAVMLFLHLSLLWIPWTFSWTNLVMMVSLHVFFGGMGVCLGYHRLLTHRGFKTPKWFEYVLATLGVLNLQGSPAHWVAQHRIHHLYSDDYGDPHDANRGFWWSHMGWMFWKHSPEFGQQMIAKFAPDMQRSAYYRWLDKWHWTLPAATLFIFWAIGGWAWAVWGCLLRVLFSFHCTWLINSACHYFGYKNFEDCADRSKNCWWGAILSFGEGWHNNHHANASSARHGLRWWEIDFTWMQIRVLKKLGLARNIITPDMNKLRQQWRELRVQRKLERRASASV